MAMKTNEEADDSHVDERTALLDRFAVSGVELERLLDLYSSKTTSKEASDANFCWLSSTITSSVLSQILPELLELFERELERVFVVGVDPSDPLYPKACFVEAALQLAGKKSQQAVDDPNTAAIYWLAKKSHDNNDPNASTPNATELTNLLYRLVLVHQELLVLGGDNNDKGEEENENKGTVTNLPQQQQQQQVEAPVCWAASLRARATSAAADNDMELVSETDWTEWVRMTAPGVSRLFSGVWRYLLFLGPHCGHSGEQQEETMVITSQRQTNWLISQYKAHVAWQLALSLPPTSLSLFFLPQQQQQQQQQYLLYQSAVGGLALATLVQAAVSFEGPTVLLIQTDQDHMIGYYTELPWKMGKASSRGSAASAWYTTTDDDDTCTSFLFRLHPSWSVYHLVSSKKNQIENPAMMDTNIPPWRRDEAAMGTGRRPRRFHQYLYMPSNSRGGSSSSYGNSSSRASTLTGLAVGGGSETSPRLHLTPSLEDCKAVSLDGVTFESGPLLGSSSPNNSSAGSDAALFESCYFNVAAMELWAVPASDAAWQAGRQSGQSKAAVREAVRQQAATVDRTQFVEDFATGAYLNALYQHRELARPRGRASFTADDDEKAGYYVESKPPSSRASGTSSNNSDSDQAT